MARFIERLLERRDVIEGWVEEVKKERSRLIRELRSIGGVEVFDSKANFVTFRPRMDADQVFKGLLERGVVIKNLGDLPVIRHCLRVTVGLPEMNDVFLRSLREILAG